MKFDWIQINRLKAELPQTGETTESIQITGQYATEDVEGDPVNKQPNLSQNTKIAAKVAELLALAESETALAVEEKIAARKTAKPSSAPQLVK